MQNMMLIFSPCKRCPCPCSDAVLRSCEEALAGIILHRPPSLWFAWVRSGCPGLLGAGAARGRGPGTIGGGGRDPRADIHAFIQTHTTHTHTHTHTTHTYQPTYPPTYLRPYIHTCISCRHAYSCIHTCIHTYMHTYIHARMHDVHTRTHIYIYINVHTHRGIVYPPVGM